jgi:NAD/NADP transhydrogenase beta subunit
MTASYQQLPIAQVQAGMVLSDELLDVQGHVLLPQGTVLTDAMLALMPRHGIEVLPIASETAASDAELQATLQHHDERIAQLFRKNDPESDSDWATGLLRRFVTDYRTGAAQEAAE